MGKLNLYVIFLLSSMLLSQSCTPPKYYVFRKVSTSPTEISWTKSQILQTEYPTVRKDPHFKTLAFIKQDLNNKGFHQISSSGNICPQLLKPRRPEISPKGMVTPLRKIEYSEVALLSPPDNSPGKDTRKVHWTNIVSFASGLLVFTGMFLFSIPAIIFGIIGIIKSGKRKKFKGQGWAIAGLGLGLLVVALLIAVIIALAILPT